MADGVVFSSTGQSPPANTVVWTDELAIGASTAHAQIVKLADPTLDSTAMLGLTSGGLHIFVVNTTVPISGNSTAIISSASKIRTESTGAVQVEDNGGSLTIDGNSTAIISTASAIRIDSTGTLTVDGLTTASRIRIESTAALTISGSVSIGSGTVSLVGGMGAGSSNPLLVRPYASGADSTWNSTTITSTAAIDLFSSGGSTRIHLTDLDWGVASTVAGVTLTVYEASTGGAVLWRQYAGPEGGWVKEFTPPKPAAAGAKIVAQIIPASTVHLNAAAYRST